jgi:hypothetical protein
MFIIREGGCWDWCGFLTKNGYGRIGSRLAHRVVYELLIGKIPAGLELDHLCRNRRCVNPSHLEPVTHRVNLLRGKTLANKESFQEHCIYGHPFSENNLQITSDGRRICRTCNKRRNKEWREKMMAMNAPRDNLGRPRALTFKQEQEERP